MFTGIEATGKISELQLQGKGDLIVEFLARHWICGVQLGDIATNGVLDRDSKV